MADILNFQLDVTLVAIELTCGHTIYVTERFRDLKRMDHNSFWCCACGTVNNYPAPDAAEPPPPLTFGEKVVYLFRKGHE